MNSKTEGLKFLFQKELKESDMGNIDRIVIPEKEAESNLPTLTNPKAMLRMVDMDTLETWTFIYRCRVNNKSKMYILENTGEFLKSHYLVLGDFIKVYKDNINGKYVIKGKKLLDNEGAFGNLIEINPRMVAMNNVQTMQIMITEVGSHTLRSL